MTISVVGYLVAVVVAVGGTFLASRTNPPWRTVCGMASVVVAIAIRLGVVASRYSGVRGRDTARRLVVATVVW